MTSNTVADKRKNMGASQATGLAGADGHPSPTSGLGPTGGIPRAAFTPGPWLIHSTRRWIVPAEHAFMEPGDALPICQLRDPDERLTEDETLNNGFLLAAAPDLYRLLDLAVRQYDAVKGGPILGALEAARPVLSKARGEVA